MIINEDTTFINVYAQGLRNAGFEVEACRDGKSGLARVFSSKPDLILLGLMLPIMNGFDVLKVLKEKKTTRPIPVLVCSHLTASGTLEEAEATAMGATAVFYKAACTPEMIVEAAKKALG